MLKTAAITLLLLGDLNFTGLQYMTEFSKNGFDPGFSFKNTSAVIQQADIAVANLEGPFTFADWSKEAEKKEWRFRQLPVFAKGIKDSGVDVLLLGNNHISDAGVNGIQDTIDALRESGLSYVPPPAEGPLIVERNGARIEFWNADVFSPAKSHQWAISREDFTEIVSRKYSGGARPDVAIAFIHDHAQDTKQREEFISKLRKAGIHWVVIGGDHKIGAMKTDSKGGVHYGMGDFIFGCECSGEVKGKALSLTVKADFIGARELDLSLGSPANGFVTSFVDGSCLPHSDTFHLDQ